MRDKLGKTMTSIEYNKLEIIKIKNLNEQGFGDITFDGLTLRVNIKWGSVSIFKKDGYAKCMSGETYISPMTACSDYSETLVCVKKGQFLHDLQKRVKEILSTPDLATFRLSN